MIKVVNGVKNNSVAELLKSLAWITWIGGGILGFILGLSAGKVASMFYTSSRFSLTTALLTWGMAFIVGIVPYGFAEIIGLLNFLTTAQYEVVQNNTNDEKNSVEHSNSKKELDSDIQFEYAVKTNENLPFVVEGLIVTQRDNQLYVKSSIRNKTSLEITSYIANITIKDLYGKEYVFSDCVFIDFTGTRLLKSSEVLINIPVTIPKIIDTIKVDIMQYIIEGKAYKPGTEPEILKNKIDSDNDSKMEKDVFLEQIASLDRKEIISYVNTIKNDTPYINNELIELIEQQLEAERIYGFGRESTLKSIRKFLDE